MYEGCNVRWVVGVREHVLRPQQVAATTVVQEFTLNNEHLFLITLQLAETTAVPEFNLNKI